MPEATSVELAAVIMGVTAGVYIGFAARADSTALALFEGDFALLFALVALAGIWLSKWLLPAVYRAHAAWDWLHGHHEGLKAIVPAWYIPLCLGVDVIAGVGLALVWLVG